MLQPTGSVYLDSPPPGRRATPEPGSSFRSTAAGLLALLGMVCLTGAAVLGAFRAVLHDPQTVMAAVDQAIDTPAARAELEAEIATGIETTMFGDDAIEAMALAGIDLRAEAARIAPLALDDPAFRAALSDVVVRTHERVLLSSSDEPLDMTAITSATRAILVRELPEATPYLPDSSSLFIITADQIPDFTAPVDLLDRIALSVAVGGILLPLAALAHPHRHRVVTWVGRWLLLLGLGAGMVAFALPWFAAGLTGSTLIETAVRDLSTRLFAPAAIAGLIGIGLVVAASVLRKRDRTQASDEGVVAALGGFDESLTLTPGVSPQMELAQRGLVDVSQPLTNI